MKVLGSRVYWWLVRQTACTPFYKETVRVLSQCCSVAVKHGNLHVSPHYAVDICSLGPVGHGHCLQWVGRVSPFLIFRDGLYKSMSSNNDATLGELFDIANNVVESRDMFMLSRRG